MSSVFAKPLIGLVRLYQKYFSAYTPPRCKYYPTCSNYALESLRIHGATKGLLLAGWRLLRCNPLSDGGVDYPPQRGHWHASEYHQMSEAELRDYWRRLDAGEIADDTPLEIPTTVRS
ncbi:MAG: membrane protein insertion efficiency factor YidD [Varibaculum sp.]|nr:membrane protein insertion efficiency factor YidD [Varibaculum sp.]